jgi:hypothetical protein
MGGSLPSGGSVMSHARLPLPLRCSYQCVGPAPVSAPPIPAGDFGRHRLAFFRELLEIGSAEVFGAAPLELVGALERRVRFVLVRVDPREVGMTPRCSRRGKCWRSRTALRGDERLDENTGRKHGHSDCHASGGSHDALHGATKEIVATKNTKRLGHEEHKDRKNRPEMEG